jgi:hypothetical protein
MFWSSPTLPGPTLRCGCHRAMDPGIFQEMGTVIPRDLMTPMDILRASPTVLQSTPAASPAAAMPQLTTAATTNLAIRQALRGLLTEVFPSPPRNGPITHGDLAGKDRIHTLWSPLWKLLSTILLGVNAVPDLLGKMSQCQTTPLALLAAVPSRA